ncbi:hypothetical protein BU24DRAFT_374656 [Aaosphaeria arxii CBS 175.79]|uniref:Protein kinase domain-containing protein n=1 Tax=Aaosphaeria arxii CBS 175.79 TaxID=1450172 RepID=A0A6A5XKK9_9PLEO|nr:uncharacterized protein BU24DRAFT_374656 [Aaosphaeria arxii CBS 175.79]KAF2012844.1 hypothetical protein BU24DRAFT_374656 [Aaosphaeria arxii CBS 175.79]
MADAIGIAGLSIAIFDQLLKLGDRTAQLISDARSFNEDTVLYHTKVIDENNRTRQLRHILFEPSPIYGGVTLFDNFDDDVQQQVKIFLGRLVHMLQEALDLLESRHGSEDKKSPALTSNMSQLSISSEQSVRSPSPRSWKSLSRQSISILKWSFQDKKRTEEILKAFSELNGRIHEQVKLWCLASSIGLNMQHLKRLQNDESAKQLGFDIDATLQITAAEAGQRDLSYQLGSRWLNDLYSATPVEQRFALVRHDNKSFLLEYRRNDGHIHQPGELDQRTRLRVNNLAGLLSQPKEKVFCIPRCIGWEYLSEKNSIAFVFEISGHQQPKPISLFQLLDLKTVRLGLTQKFRLALSLSKCITQLQLVKWVHESFRSENIIFFPRAASFECDEEEGIDYSDPSVLGFEFARPELDFSAGFADLCIDRDVYRHPERQGRPGRMFNKIHDIYALGVVLLEIGLWQRAITLEKNHFRTARDPYVIQSQLIKQAQRRLHDKMGDKYQKIVIACLTGEFGVDPQDNLKLQQAFRSQVVDTLESISNAL